MLKHGPFDGLMGFSQVSFTFNIYLHRSLDYSERWNHVDGNICAGWCPCSILCRSTTEGSIIILAIFNQPFVFFFIQLILILLSSFT